MKKGEQASGSARQTIATLLRADIERHARRIAREENAALREAVTRYRHDIAALKRQVAQLEREGSGLRRVVAKRVADAPAPAPSTVRFIRKGLVSHRTKLGLSAEHYAKLAGVSHLSIYAWEAGKSEPRTAGRVALAGIRTLGKREALRRLAELGVEVGPRSRHRNRRVKAAKGR